MKTAQEASAATLEHVNRIASEFVINEVSNAIEKKINEGMYSLRMLSPTSALMHILPFWLVKHSAISSVSCLVSTRIHWWSLFQTSTIWHSVFSSSTRH